VAFDFIIAIDDKVIFDFIAINYNVILALHKIKLVN
jgi:hypothetical protein